MPENFFHIATEREFNEAALDLFRRQAENCDVYRAYISALRVRPDKIKSICEIPYLPIDFFKSFEVKTGVFDPEMVFTSSGTTGQKPSLHFVKRADTYIESFVRGFELFYGPVTRFAILGLLPSYLERQGSSLVYMADHFVRHSEYAKSGFFLHDHEALRDTLLDLKARKIPTLLIGVTFGLLDFAEAFQVDFPGLILMETGGMKGRREEMIREEVHNCLKNAFGVSQVHSEYGMTELLSQAYSFGDGIFKPVPWMKVLRREITDPFAISSEPGSGALNVIDLSNGDSCAFIATQDLVKLRENGRFEVMGRFDHAEVRGCNLMVV